MQQIGCVEIHKSEEKKRNKEYSINAFSTLTIAQMLPADCTVIISNLQQ